VTQVTTDLGAFMKPTRVLRPIRAVLCPRDLRLVPAAGCKYCEDYAEPERPNRKFWIPCGYNGGGMEYAKMRAKMEGPR